MSNANEQRQANAWVPADLKRWIKERADEEHRSQSNFIRKVLEERREREQQTRSQATAA